MNRRDFLRSTGIVSASLALAKTGRFFATDTAADHWRTFNVTTRVEVLKTSGTTRIWLPAPLINQAPFQKTISTSFHAEGGTAKTAENNPDSLGIIVAEFPSGVTQFSPSQAGSRLRISLIELISTRDGSPGVIIS